MQVTPFFAAHLAATAYRNLFLPKNATIELLQPTSALASFASPKRERRSLNLHYCVQFCHRRLHNRRHFHHQKLHHPCRFFHTTSTIVITYVTKPPSSSSPRSHCLHYHRQLRQRQNYYRHQIRKTTFIIQVTSVIPPRSSTSSPSKTLPSSM